MASVADESQRGDTSRRAETLKLAQSLATLPTLIGPAGSTRTTTIGRGSQGFRVNPRCACTPEDQPWLLVPSENLAWEVFLH